MEQTRIYPLGKKESAKPMQFPNASATPANMLYPQDGTAFDMLGALHRSTNMSIRPTWKCAACWPRSASMKGKPFSPDAQTATLLDKARAGPRPASATRSPTSRRRWCRTAVVQGPAVAQRVSRQRDVHRATRSTIIDPRTGFFTYAYSTSPGMAVNMVNVGAKYPATFVDADGDFLSRTATATSCTCRRTFRRRCSGRSRVYDPITGIGPRQRPAFPSINTMDKPVEECGRLDRHLLRPEVARRRQELAAHAARQGLLRDPAALRPDEGVLRSDLEAGRHRAGI